ncbi:MAG: anion transporter [Steroidobacteraceae bacterium]|nr:anion transporter [Steroidobacteraceae bacterium]MBM2853228.1 anion transporter [Steroidobacteraceae bacterium]
MNEASPVQDETAARGMPRVLRRWALVAGIAAAILWVGPPAGITPQGWRLLAIFVATIAASIVRPAPMGAVVFIAVCVLAVTGTMTPADALAGYADPIVWLVLCAFMISRSVTKTGLGRRIAYEFIRLLGGRSLGLAYALVATDTVLASVVPSNAARAGGIVFPVARSVAEAYESTPGLTRRRLGAFLMTAVYQADVVACAMFLTGQASNVIIAKFALSTGGVELSYATWFIGGVVPGIASLLLVVYLIYRIYPPEVRLTPHATQLARDELRRMGPMSRDERIMLAVFVLIAGLWMTTAWHHIPYTVVALFGVSALLLTNVLTWEDALSDRQAWDTFIWYGGLVHMAEALGDTGVTRQFAEFSAGMTAGWGWELALAVLLLVYFYAHYGFASITAHVTAMYIPFLVVMIAAGAPPVLAVLGLAYASNLQASLTHYGTTPAPIYFGSGYVTQREWWTVGFVISIVTLTIWGTLGLAWWKLLGWW